MLTGFERARRSWELVMGMKRRLSCLHHPMTALIPNSSRIGARTQEWRASVPRLPGDQA